MVAAARADPVLAPYIEAIEGYGRSSIRLRPDRERRAIPW